MVECECINALTLFDASRVLIDTWWNVNDLPNFSYANHGKVLIDTWWNVNSFHPADE